MSCGYYSSYASAEQARQEDKNQVRQGKKKEDDRETRNLWNFSVLEAQKSQVKCCIPAVLRNTRVATEHV